VGLMKPPLKQTSPSDPLRYQIKEF
jgi:hypothetical protein